MQRRVPRLLQGEEQRVAFLQVGRPPGLRAKLARTGLERGGSPRLTVTASNSPFGPSRMHLCSVHPSPGAQGLQASASGTPHSHLGLSVPIYLVVALNPAPHTTDIFLL